MTFRDLTGTLRLSNTTEHRQKGTCFLVETRVSVLTIEREQERRRRGNVGVHR